MFHRTEAGKTELALEIIIFYQSVSGLHFQFSGLRHIYTCSGPTLHYCSTLCRGIWMQNWFFVRKKKWLSVTVNRPPCTKVFCFFLNFVLKWSIFHWLIWASGHQTAYHESAGFKVQQVTCFISWRRVLQLLMGDIDSKRFQHSAQQFYEDKLRFV